MAYRYNGIVKAAEKASESMGYNLREKQREVILSFVQGRDVFVHVFIDGGAGRVHATLAFRERLTN